MTKTSNLTQKQIFWFWLPLAAMWLMMAVEQPSLTAMVSRLPEATKNLAAFGMTFSFALLVESPVIMLLTACTALTTHQQAYRRLLHFTHILTFTFTALHVLLAVTPLYPYILREWVGAPVEIIETSHMAFLLMTPWTPGIAYRRFWQGVMIRYGHPQRVTLVVVARLIATITVLLVGFGLGRWAGAYVAAVALSVGVSVAAVAAWLFALPTIRQEIPEMSTQDDALEWKPLITFYIPLALTSLISIASQPILAFGLSRAPMPLESLAIWPVMMGLLFIGRSMALACQEVVVALLKDAQSYAMLRTFVWRLAISTSAFFVLLALTPGVTFWYRYISGLTPELAQLAILPTIIMAIIPGINAFISWYRGVLVHNQHTTPISIAVALNMGTLLILMSIFPYVANVAGAVLAAAALTASLVVESLFLWWQSRLSVAKTELAEVALGD
ncbi:MAG: hypothetical protein ACPGWR_19690 [Ardenticatenaceae bacterium]